MYGSKPKMRLKTTMNYNEFIQQKAIRDVPTGIKNASEIELNGKLFDFQRDVVKWALWRGRACIWADCGLGKTFMQLEWARVVNEYTGKPVIIIAPLAVSEQTANIEAPKLGITVKIASKQSEITDGINITNYEKLDKFDLTAFGGVVLDESSIIKNFAGKIRNTVIESTQSVPFRLACTATPSPNDYMELGNHAEFVGAMTYTEMLAMFFIHDGGDTAKWRLKRHGKKAFFKWVASWAVFIRKPSDLGYSDEGFKLPEIEFIDVIVPTAPTSDSLFVMDATTLQERQAARRESIEDRVKAAVRVIEANKETENDQFCCWCNLNAESDEVSTERPCMVNIQGSDSNEYKTKNMLAFAKGELAEIVSKPKIAGLGMNWQNCHNVIFLGLSDSYEQFYQAVRRFYRFGQKKTVHVWIVTADTEGAVVENIRRKERDANNMYSEMVQYMNTENRIAVSGRVMRKTEYNPTKTMMLPAFI